MKKNCATCKHAGRDCIPYLMTLTQEDFLAWCKCRKNALRISNDDIASRTNVPKSTVDRIFSPKDTDCRFSTIQPLICILSGCDEVELDCDNREESSEVLEEKLKAKDEIIEQLKIENKRLEEHINKVRAKATVDLERAKEEETVSLDYMKKLASKRLIFIYILVALLFVAMVVIITALVIDKNNSSVGFFWLRSIFGGNAGTHG